MVALPPAEGRRKPSLEARLRPSMAADALGRGYRDHSERYNQNGCRPKSAYESPTMRAMPNGPRLRARLSAAAIVIGLSLLVSVGAVGAAADDSQTRARLEQVRERIEAVRAELQAEREQRDRTSAQLAQLEKRIGAAAQRIDELDQRLTQIRERLQALAERQRSLEQELDAHRTTLAAQLRAAHRFGRQPALRLLLRQDDPGSLARAMGYYGYFNRARLEAVEQAQAAMAELQTVMERTRASREELGQTRADLADQRNALEESRAERARLLQELRADIAAGGEELERLKASRERLERLLKKLDDMLGDIPAAPLEQRPFDAQANALPWPVDGELRARFGQARASGRTRWRGIVIDAARGQAVRAVYYGRVVFADWLEGFGQLLIVDHLDGYMSLYGYNQRLLRGAGDWVAPGDPIARVGTSGGQRNAGLYFEVRHEGEPTDPLSWLRAR